MSDDTDPVKAALAGEIDLYDVATWDVRTVVDALAVRVYGLLVRAKSVVLVALAVSLFFAQMAFIAPLVAEEPRVGVLPGLSVVPALLLAGYLWYIDPTRRQPLDALAGTFLLGVLFAVFAALLNTLLLPVFASIPTVGLVLFFFLVVGPVEESVKWLAVRVSGYDTPSFTAVVDGVVFGAVAGLGFATIENFIYITRAYLLTAGAGMAQLQVTIQTATQRAFVGPGHVIYSAFAGYYLGLAKFNRDRWGPIVVKGLLIAAFIHAFYNTVVSTIPLTVPAFIAFVFVYDGLLLGVLYRKLKRYEQLYGVVLRRAALSEQSRE